VSFFKKLKERVTSPKATITLKLDKNSFIPGEKMKGILAVTSEEEFDATEIRAEFRCTEKTRKERWETETTVLPGGRTQTRQVKRVYWETRTLFSEDPQGSGPLRLSAGYRGEFPFSTAIPEGGTPSYANSNSSITWEIKGVIGVKGRPDVTSSTTTIQVVEAGETAQVLMIPCEYCRTLFPQADTACPNCGAPRKD